MSATNPLESAAPEPAEQGAAREPYHKGNVPQRLLEAAELILESETVEDITARRLCRDIGVTSANFYNHYPSLDYLLLEIAAKGFEVRSQMMTKLLRSNLSNEEMMISCAIQTVDLNLQHPQLFRIMFGYIKNPQQNETYVSKADESLAMLTHIVYGEDIFRADDIKWSHENCQKAYAFFAFIYGLAAAMATSLISNPRGTRTAQREFVAELTRTYLHKS
ncbi:TetR/AcrR family transcriptional regulator [Sandaracinobacter neustonicus]|uniref:TetR/AcrR family transcriptional regulator n=1 Tax=Sandaracinobacter neustonicus TaxID=1715348 RepID=A0A501XXY7_9SPHN|nr:TetR/AcrR family transcriptional regulator [Sandaracinobacter neustonicus]TPE64954.1 TetR/AcrR family transcriptional regulator [Sandaracinobacter neustonicus]